MKDDIGSDLKWPLKVISSTVNGFMIIVCILEIQHIINTKSITVVRRHMWEIISTVVFNWKDCYLTLSATC